jgi:hypothetical protein
VGAKETRRSSLSSRGFLVPFSRSSPGSSSWNERKRSLKEYKVQSATRLQRCEKGSKGELKRTESIGLTVRILSKKPILLSASVRDFDLPGAKPFYVAAEGGYTEKLDMRETTNETVRIAGISGSLRRASFSTALLKILAEKALPAIEIQVVTLEDIPLYNEDLDRKPEVPAVAAFKRVIAESDGVLIATPEYNHGIPGVLKNALDRASRPVFESCFRHKPVSIISFVFGFYRWSARAVSVTGNIDFDGGPSRHGA